MSEFIEVQIDYAGCLGIQECGGCARVCPVNIFEKDSARPRVVPENEDECTLCDLCIQICSPGVITIRKLYEA